MGLRICVPPALGTAILLLGLTLANGGDTEPISPKGSAIRLFNGKDLDGLYTWLKDAKYQDPRKVFTVEDGMLHISGDGMGYICTKQRYKDYHLVVEYRWGDRTWLWRKARAKDCGVIVHCAEPDGSYDGIFMAGVEAQITEGGTGDLWVVPGKRANGIAIPVSLTVETTKDRNGKIVWQKGGQPVTVKPRTNMPECIGWFGKDPDWKDLLGFRGQRDIESPGKAWTRLDVICDGRHIIYRVNGIQANEGFDAEPSSGKILIQTEAAEAYIRRFELQPLNDEPLAVAPSEYRIHLRRIIDWKGLP